MLQALTRFFRGRVDAAQLELTFDRAVPRNAEELLARLKQLGLRRIARVRLTRNRTVMVSYAGSELRVNEGYLNATENVLRAIVVFAEGRTRAERRAAQKVIIEFPFVQRPVPRVERRERTHGDDAAMVAQLESWHARYNTRHFEGGLKTVPIRVSRRMKSRLGHYSPANGDVPAEIAISRTHIRRHGWPEALHTLVHEMVHQWQDETKRPIDHGRGFRAKCREVGIAPYARRALTTARQSNTSSIPVSEHARLLQHR